MFNPSFLVSLLRAFIHRYLFIEVQAADYNCIVGKKIFEEWQLFQYSAHTASGPEIFKKSRQKTQFREIAFLNFSPVKKLIFGHFEIAKNGIWSKKIFVTLIYLISRVFLPGLFKIFGPTVQYSAHWAKNGKWVQIIIIPSKTKINVLTNFF